MWIDDGCLDKSDSPPTVASHDHLPLDVWPPSYQEVSGEAGDFDPVAVGSDHTHGDADGDVDGDADDCVDAGADAIGSDHTHGDADGCADADISHVDGDGAGDGGDISRGHWRHSCTLYHHHGNLEASHFQSISLCICRFVPHFLDNFSHGSNPVD